MSTKTSPKKKSRHPFLVRFKPHIFEHALRVKALRPGVSMNFLIQEAFAEKYGLEA